MTTSDIILKEIIIYNNFNITIEYPVQLVKTKNFAKLFNLN